MWLFSLRNASKSSGHFGIRNHFNDYNLLYTWRIDTHTIHHLFSHSICLPAGIRQFDSNHQMCNFKWAKFMCELFGTTDALWKLLSGIIWNVLVIFASRFFSFSVAHTHRSLFFFLLFAISKCFECVCVFVFFCFRTQTMYHFLFATKTFFFLNTNNVNDGFFWPENDFN